MLYELIVKGIDGYINQENQVGVDPLTPNDFFVLTSYTDPLVAIEIMNREEERNPTKTFLIHRNAGNERFGPVQL